MHLSVCMRATTRYLAMVLRMRRPLSSCPRMQVEMNRQQESGHGIMRYCAHHRVITMLGTVNKYFSDIYTINLILKTFLPHVETQHKCHWNQIRIFLAVETDLLELFLELDMQYLKYLCRCPGCIAGSPCRRGRGGTCR